ncbi:unnamed protein product [Plutella xylostella]|uniref:(diamondback moth) hypothetical protein n=1 Tax=Plutella xylostella TaxID=51655 RepID=A0A8S4ELP7_PLUXY|nr:unnamed protein product [Plutella xylostella]
MSLVFRVMSHPQLPEFQQCVAFDAFSKNLQNSACNSLVFRVMSHPQLPEFQQCVAFDAFSNRHQETAYNVLCLVAMYFLPLLIITVCYGCIFYEISKNSTVVSGELAA